MRWAARSDQARTLALQGLYSRQDLPPALYAASRSVRQTRPPQKHPLLSHLKGRRREVEGGAGALAHPRDPKPQP